MSLLNSAVNTAINTADPTGATSTAVSGMKSAFSKASGGVAGVKSLYSKMQNAVSHPMQSIKQDVANDKAKNEQRIASLQNDFGFASSGASTSTSTEYGD